MAGLQFWLRERESFFHATLNAQLIPAAWAAVSADPETCSEFCLALERFASPELIEPLFRALTPVRGTTPPSLDGEILLIDLAARYVLLRSARLSPRRSGEVVYASGAASPAIQIPYYWPDGWQIRPFTADCQTTLADHSAATSPGVGSAIGGAWEAGETVGLGEQTGGCGERAVLYDRLVEFLAAEFLAARTIAVRTEPQAVQERWLLTPRTDLAGRTPRQVLLARRQEINRDLSSRYGEWMALGRCSPGIPVGSRAFREAGIGRHEHVLYFELVQWLCGLLWSPHGEAVPATEDRLSGWLAEMRDRWLDQPQEDDLQGATPRQLIDLERQRIPWTVDASRSIIDHDCPLCRMLAAEQPGPIFCHLDGVPLAAGFAWSDCATWDDWQRAMAEQAAWEEEADARAATENSGSEWRLSGLSEEGLETLHPAQRAKVWHFRVLAQLLELLDDTAADVADQKIVRAALERMEEFRTARQEPLDWLAESCLHDTGTLLGELAVQCPKLQGKCEDVRHVIQLLQQDLQSSPAA